MMVVHCTVLCGFLFCFWRAGDTCRAFFKLWLFRSSSRPSGRHCHHTRLQLLFLWELLSLPFPTMLVGFNPSEVFVLTILQGNSILLKGNEWNHCGLRKPACLCLCKGCRAGGAGVLLSSWRDSCEPWFGKEMCRLVLSAPIFWLQYKGNVECMHRQLKQKKWLKQLCSLFPQKLPLGRNWAWRAQAHMAVISWSYRITEWLGMEVGPSSSNPSAMGSVASC